jgi:arylsulfatase A-like enzyme
MKIESVEIDRTMPNRRQFITALTGSTAIGTCFSRGAVDKTARPNFVFILADDLGWADLGCYGSTYYQTPNIDRLASQGMRFTNAYAACPVCSPTRASILTGKYPARLQLTDFIPGRRQWPTSKLLKADFRQELPLEEITIAEMLKPHGYHSASIGKWHLGDAPFTPEAQGFDLNIGGTYRGAPESYFGPFKLPGLKDSLPGEYLTDRLTDEALRFIELNRDHPFFVYLPHFTVHLPLQAKADVEARYRAVTNKASPQHNPTYAAMVEAFDDSVGRVMKKLDELGLADNTILFLNSDNGGLLYETTSTDNVTSNKPLRAGKGHLYEGGIREPLIVRWPGVVKPGAVCDEPVCSIDYFPTIREMSRIDAKGAPPIDGVSLAPLLRNGTGVHHEALYWHYPHYSNQGGPPEGAIRVGNYKLIEFFEDGRLELYNLTNDIGERHNLAQAEPAKAAELHTRLVAWRESVGAVMPRPNPAYDSRTADLGLYGSDPAHQ